jgi:flagellin-specific chaperone FliS
MATPALAGQPQPQETGVRGLADQAWQQYSRAQELLRQGNFAAYGEEVKRLESTLKTLRERAK